MIGTAKRLRQSAALNWSVRILVIAAAAAGGAVAAEQPQENLARGKKYSLSPRPNYKYCTDPGDQTQLTDGQTTGQYFWTQGGTVGWSNAGHIAITVDLGRVEPIAGASFRTAAGRAGVRWPGAIHILTSDDGKTYRDAGDLVALDREVNGPWPAEYAIRRLVTSKLHTRGRFVRFLILPTSGSPYTFCDEVEVLRGAAELLEGNPGGTPVGDVETLFRQWRVRQGVRRRFEADIAGIEGAIRTADLPDEATRVRLLNRLEEAGEALLASTVEADESFSTRLPMNRQHEELFHVQADLWKTIGRPQLAAWAVPPWDPIDPFAMPQSGPGKIELHFMPGEYRAAALNLSNSTDRPILAGIVLRGPLRSPVRCATIRAAVWTDTVEGRPVAAALEPVSLFEDAGTVTVLPGLVQQVWLTYHVSRRPASEPPAFAPGPHSGAVHILSSGKTPPKQIPVRLHLSGLNFPEETTLMLGGWSYTDAPGGRGVTAGNRKALVQHLRRRFVNAPWATSRVMMQMEFADDETVRLDTRDFDDWIAQWPDARRYMVYLSVGGRFAGTKVGTPEFERRVRSWISAWVGHLGAKGIGPERLGLLLHDEPHEGTDVGPMMAWAKAIRSARPEVLIWEDPTYRDPAEAPAELFEVCDVLCPNRPMWLSQGAPFARFYRDQRSQGRELQLYSCSGPVRLLDPYSYYRLQAWHCWQAGATGSFFWAFGDNGGVSSWNPYLASAGPYTPLFLDETGVVAGKHMEAIRESVEDYEYFAMLREAVQKANAAGRSDAALAKARLLLSMGADEALAAEGAAQLRWHEPKNRTIADDVRVRILEALKSLH